MLATSIVLSCRPRGDRAPTITRAEFIREMKSELNKGIIQLQNANVSP